MAKTKTKFKGLVKGAALGFALIMASAFFPANAVASAVDYNTGNDARLNVSRIEVDGNNQSFSVKRGDEVPVPAATYSYKKVGGTAGIHTIGTTADADAVAAKISSSSVSVYYKATGDFVTVKDGKFTADEVGTYVIEYSVVVDGIPYTYEQLVSVEASEASFEFEKNDKNIIPSVYDIALAEEKLAEADRDIVLPLPTVNDDKGNPILTSADEDYYTNDKASYTLPTGENAKKYYVSISLAISLNGQESQLAIKSRDVEIEGSSDTKKEYYLSYADLKNLDGQDIKIFYAFYQKSSGNDVFVASTSKTFTVKSNYYYTKSDKKAVGYELVASRDGVKPDNAVVGVEKAIPTIKATTSSTNAPSSEAVEVYYDLVVYKANANGNYNDNNDVTSQVVTKDGKFKAIEEGSYKFVYKVSDFYGNNASEASTTFTINKVKDSVAATAYVYDAGHANAYDEKENKYESAENLLKNQTVNRNIIMYAVGGTDNMVKRFEDLTPEEIAAEANHISLKRAIKDNSGIDRFVVDDDAYHAYNLIFAPGKAAGSTTSVWQTIVKDNYQIYKQMILEGSVADVTNDEKIQEFLLENNYRLVTTKFNKDFNGNDIITETGLTDEEIKAKMLDAGYAYVEPKTANYSFENKEGTFTFYYYANDNVNNNKEASIYFPVKLANSFDDQSVPTITFSSNLQSAYLPSETFEFNVASATDSVASRLTTVTAYRYLDADKVALPANETAGTTKKLEYVVMNANSALMNTTTGKWFAQKGIVESEGWFIDNDASSYKVDLTKRTAGANYIEILAYAIDDYGNVGFFNKVIRIADTTDGQAPVLYKVVNAPEATTYKAPNQIPLPTLYFSDANANYMHAQVNVYKVVKGASVQETTKTLVQSSGMKTSYDTQREYFKVDAGVFNASVAGEYQVAVTVVDSGNHSVTSYFNYSVAAGESTETPKIDNISADTIELEPGQAHYLVPPTFTMIENSAYGYVGIDDQDDAYTSTHYNVSIIEATTSDYNLEETYFFGNSEGTYKLQYTAFLLQYQKSALAAKAEAEDGELFFDNDKLMYRVQTGTDAQTNPVYTDYYVYIDQENNNALTANTSLQGDGAALADMTGLNAIAKVYVDQSDVQIIKVSEVFIKVLFDDDDYAVDKYDEVGHEVKIVKPAVDFKGNGATMNRKESTVTITRTMGGTTTTIATLNFEDWQKVVQEDTTNFKVVGSDIYLKLKDNGQYKIKYSIQAQAGGQNIGDPNTDYVYTLSSGDTEKPTIEINNKTLIKDQHGNEKQVFNIGDKLVIDMAAITVDDNATKDRDTLLGNLEVTYRNTTLNESAKLLDNKATEEGKYVYEIESLTAAGDYVLTFTIRDGVGNISEQTTVNFEVSTKSSDPVSAKEVMGGVLIGVSVALLAGVVGYFVISKVKLDRKEKGYKNAGKDKKND